MGNIFISPYWWAHFLFQVCCFVWKFKSCYSWIQSASVSNFEPNCTLQCMVVFQWYNTLTLDIWYILVVKCGMWVLYWYEGNRAMRWKLCYVQLINSELIVPNASIHVNGMNSNSYHFQMSPLKYITYLPSLGRHQLLKMCGGSIIHGTVFRPHASSPRILLWNMQWVRNVYICFF